MSLQVICASGIVETVQNLQVLYGYYICVFVCVLHDI